MSDAGNLGTLTYKSESQNDVTMSYVDVESHIKAFETERDSLMLLMEKSESLSDVIALQSRLTEVNYQLDSYKSQLRKYDNLISYCTVNIDVIEVVREVLPESEMTFGERIKRGLEDSFENIGLVVVLVILLIKLIIRKNRAKKLSTKQVKEYVRQINEDNNSDNN